MPATPMNPDAVPDELVDLAREAFNAAPQKRDGKPTRMRHALAAVLPAAAQRDAEHAASALTGAYRERARLVAYLATQHPAFLAYTDPDEPEWAVVYVHTPAGQMSWHISPDDVELFDHVPEVTPDDARVQWDNHTTDEKYERLALMTRFMAFANTTRGT